MLLHYDAVKQNIFVYYIKNMCRGICILTLPRQLFRMNLGAPPEKRLIVPTV